MAPAVFPLLDGPTTMTCPESRSSVRYSGVRDSPHRPSRKGPGVINGQAYARPAHRAPISGP